MMVTGDLSEYETADCSQLSANDAKELKALFGDDPETSVDCTLISIAMRPVDCCVVTVVDATGSQVMLIGHILASDNQSIGTITATAPTYDELITYISDHLYPMYEPQNSTNV